MKNFIQHLNDYILNDERIIMVLKNDGFKQVLKDAIESFEKENASKVLLASETTAAHVERHGIGQYYMPFPKCFGEDEK